MKLGFFIAATFLAVGLAGAQDFGKSKTRVIVEEGKEMTVTGCVQRNAEGSYTLTNVAGKDGSAGTYILARLGDRSDDEVEDLAGLVGKRVEVTGKAADQRDGKIRVETKSEVKKADGDTARTETKSEVKGDLDGLPYLGVKSSRMIASVCP